MIAEIEVLPTPAGTAEETYANVKAAIAVIQASGLPYEVEPLGTTFEGDPDAVWATLRSVHEATLDAGADRVVTVIKVFQGRDDAGPTVDDLVGGFRS